MDSLGLILEIAGAILGVIVAAAFIGAAFATLRIEKLVKQILETQTRAAYTNQKQLKTLIDGLTDNA